MPVDGRYVVLTGEFQIRESEKRDDRMILPSGEVGNLHDLYKVEDNKLQLRIKPEDVQVLN